MAANESLKATTKVRDPRKRFLRTGGSRSHGLLSEGGTSCSESDFDVSSPQSVCSSTSYPSSARSPGAANDPFKSVKSPGSPIGGPLSFPSIGSINSPYSDYGPLSVSELLKSPESSAADCQDTEFVSDPIHFKDDRPNAPPGKKLISLGKDNSSNSSSNTTSSAPKPSASIGKSDFNYLPPPEKRYSDHVDRPTISSSPTSSTTPPPPTSSKSQFEIHQPFLHQSQVEGLVSAEKQRQLEALYKAEKADQRHTNRDIYDPIRNRSPRSERFSPIGKGPDSTSLYKQHSLGESNFDARFSSVGFSLGTGGESRNPFINVSASSHSRSHQANSGGGVSSSVEAHQSGMKEFVNGIPPSWSSSGKGDHHPRADDQHNMDHGLLNIPNIHSERGGGQLPDPGVHADALTDHMAIEILRQEVFKRTAQGLDLPPDFPWYSSQRQNGSVSASGHVQEHKRPGFGVPGGISRGDDKGQHGICMDLSNNDSRLAGHQAGVRGMGGAMGGHSPHGNSVSPSSGPARDEKPVTGAVESTSADVDIHVCQICGDVAAGFHCGAYVCEACKKFFVRCLKQENGVKFVCPRNKSCNITKETRTQCQHCRYQKCLSIGMYRPGGANISSEICHIPCKVCGAPSSGYHFGAITCEGCKGFFRRTIKERDSMKYQCSRNGSCTITTATRNVCKYCRYRKCLDVGMKADGSRIGRQPNSVKHATMIQLKQIKSSKGLETGDLPVRIEQVEQVFKQEPEMDSSYGMNLATTAREAPVNPSVSMSGLHRQHSYPPDMEAGFRHALPEMIPRRTSEDMRCVQDMLPLSRDRGFPPLLPPAVSSSAHMGEPCVSMSYGGPVPISREVPFGHLADINDSPVEQSPMYSRSNSNIHSSVQSSPGDSYSPSSKSSHDVPSEKPIPMETDSMSLPSASSEGMDTAHLSAPPSNSSHSKDIGSDTSSPGKVLTGESKLEPADLDKIVSSLQSASRYLDPIKRRSDDAKVLEERYSMVETWHTMMAQFGQSAHSVLRFAKKVPGFKKLPIQEQIATVQSCMYPIVLTILSMDYDLETKKYNYFHMTDDEERIVMEKFPPFKHIIAPFHSVGLAVKQISIDWTEVAFLCALHLLGEGSNQESQSLLVSALERYCKKIYGEGSNRHGLILLRLGDLVKANLCHQKAVMEILTQPDKFSGITIPELFQETFINT